MSFCEETDILEGSMKIKILRGTNEIGGSCVELRSETTTILIDYGTAPVKAVFMMSQYWEKEGGDASRAIINELKTLKGLQLANFDEKLCIEFVFLGNFKGKNIDNKYLYKDNDEYCIQARDISNAL